MDLTCRMSPEERLEMKRKRIAFIQETTKGYSSIEEYARDKDEWFAIIGILNKHMAIFNLWGLSTIYRAARVDKKFFILELSFAMITPRILPILANFVDIKAIIYHA